jgi:hypothetical protein
VKAPVLTQGLTALSRAARTAGPPVDPFEARALADAALILQGDLLDLVTRIHDHHQGVRRWWVDQEAHLDPSGGTAPGVPAPPPPPPPPPPPTDQADPKGDGRGGGFPPPPPPGGGR